jgi:osmotically-inducible protein OsmY
VLRRLDEHPLLSHGSLKVLVEHGVVTLIGTVEGYERKAAATQAAYNVRGVVEVVNRLAVLLKKPQEWTRATPSATESERRSFPAC